MFTAEHLHLIYKILEMTGYAGAPTSVNWAAGVAIFYPPPNGAGLLLGVG